MSSGRALESAGGWLDDRFRGSRGIRVFLRKVFPDHWTFLLGEIALYSFIILLLTGTFLTLFFQPSMSTITYHGSYLPLQGVHMIRIFFTGAYRKPREVNWLIGIILFTLGLLEGLFGYSLPDDLLSGAGLRILEGVIQ